MSVLEEATKCSLTPPTGPVSLEIPIDVQRSLIKKPDNIPNVNYVRNELAVTPEFKPEVGTVQKFLIPEGVQIQRGTVGPQTFEGTVYAGGGSQVQILNYSDEITPQITGRQTPSSDD